MPALEGKGPAGMGDRTALGRGVRFFAVVICLACYQWVRLGTACSSGKLASFRGKIAGICIDSTGKELLPEVHILPRMFLALENGRSFQTPFDADASPSLARDIPFGVLLIAATGGHDSAARISLGSGS
jgi:hypothetical protein